MKKFFKFLPLLLIFMFTSCVDYVQSISYKKGKYELCYKMEVSKSLLEMAEMDSDEFLDDLLSEAVGIPKGVDFKTIDDDYGVGFLFNLSIAPDTTDPGEREFLPMVNGNKICIPLMAGEEGMMDGFLVEQDEETEAIVESMLASAKCRVLVAKNIIPSISGVYLEGYFEDFKIPFYDYGDVFSLEIPFNVLTLTNYYDVSKVIIEM